MIPVAFFMNTADDLLFDADLFNRFAAVGTISIQGLMRIFLFTQEWFHLFTVMDVGSSDLISSNEFGSTVCLHMILVSKVALAIVFDPFGIGIFLTELIFFPR